MLGVARRRWITALPLAALLYGCGIAAASDAPLPHIALLLPVNSTAFGRHADAVKAGFLAAARTQGRAPLPIRLYAVTEAPQHVAAGYRQALASGARIVVGPLTRGGVSAVAAAATTVPTLALNAPEAGGAMPPHFYVMSLQIETEARQAAQLAWRDGRRSALTVVGDAPLYQRMHQAFVEEFTRLGGRHAAEYAYAADAEALNRLKLALGLNVADMAFLALDFARARLVRPYLGALALYATSQLHPGAAGALAVHDLAGVHFVDMPWLLQPDHPAVMIYPRADFRDELDLERLYALGIDAFRVAQALLEGRTALMLDGVTGQLALGPDRHVARELTRAQFRDGRLAVIGAAPP